MNTYYRARGATAAVEAKTSFSSTVVKFDDVNGNHLELTLDRDLAEAVYSAVGGQLLQQDKDDLEISELVRLA